MFAKLNFNFENIMIDKKEVREGNNKYHI